MEQREQKHKLYLQRISNILLLNGGFMDNIGLFTGEMGIVLFFFRYSRISQNELYSHYCYELIEKIQHRIRHDTPVDYKQGITGIGSAIEYLAQNRYIESNTDDILEEFDKRIFSMNKLPCLLFHELLGISYYAFWRMSGNSVNKDYLLHTILPQFVHAMDEKCKKHDVSHQAVSFFKNITSPETTFHMNDNTAMTIWNQMCFKNYPFGLDSNTCSQLLQKFSTNNAVEKVDYNLGVQNGLAGLGISLMTELDGDNSWISLFPL